MVDALLFKAATSRRNGCRYDRFSQMYEVNDNHYISYAFIALTTGKGMVKLYRLAHGNCHLDETKM